MFHKWPRCVGLTQWSWLWNFDSGLFNLFFIRLVTNVLKSLKWKWLLMMYFHASHLAHQLLCLQIRLLFNLVSNIIMVDVKHPNYDKFKRLSQYTIHYMTKGCICFRWFYAAWTRDRIPPWWILKWWGWRTLISTRPSGYGAHYRRLLHSLNVAKIQHYFFPYPNHTYTDSGVVCESSVPYTYYKPDNLYINYAFT